MVVTRHMGRSVAAAMVVVSVLGIGACQPQQAPDRYVAIGDSSPAGPLVLPLDLSHVACARSMVNHPKLVADKIDVASSVDVTCSGAMIEHTTATQQILADLPATNPPQFDHLDGRTKVATITIGANNTGWSALLGDCAAKSVMLRTCRPDYVQGGVDTMMDRMRALQPRLVAMLSEAKRRAPRAKIFMVGYPTVLPASGPGCFPLLPLLPSDVAWARTLELALNESMRTAAAEAGALFIDLKPGTAGHDICSPDRWYEGLIPGAPATPFHANAAGHRGAADVVAAAINRELAR